MFRTLLIANRGEIAVRIIRTCRALGMRSVAVFSDADRDALHVRLADAAVHLGPAPAAHSYLAIDRIIAAARESGAEAVHPGYGMLSENADFAAAVAAAGLVFVGPAPAALELAGDKVAARALAAACGVPVLPGSAAVDAGMAVAEAARLGYPVLVKAAGGGGGRGMRLVRDAAGLADALADAAREAGAAFGRDAVFLERYLERPRHVEVQVLADAHGTVLHLGDRDCSVQRRHQKLVEEAPAPGLAPALRQALHDAACRLAARMGLAGAATVEFLVEPGAEGFHFLEINPRLQVEHGVSELVTGIDLVEWQLRIAAGARLDLRQEALAPRGHAMQVRIAAEDPAHGFRPAPGRIATLRLPGGAWLRADFGVEAGDAVPGQYDSMLGKLLAWGEDRDTARRRLRGALAEFALAPLANNAAYMSQVLDDPAFCAIGHDIQWLERDGPARPAPAPAAEPAGFRRRVLTTPQGVIELETYVAQPQARPAAARAARQHATASAAVPAGLAVAPIDATVLRVAVVPGQAVDLGATLVLLVAMKMELVIQATRPGTVAAVHVQAGMTVKAGMLLVSLGE